MKLRDRWLRKADDTVAAERKRALVKLDKMEETLWDAWDRSLKDELVRTMGKVTDEGSGDGAGQAEGSERKSDNVRKVNRDGDAAFTRQILDIQDRRAKILGLYAPEKKEVTGANGGPLQFQEAKPLTDEALHEVIRRHNQREAEDANRAAASKVVAASA